MAGYWNETKSSVSTYPLVKDKLLTGIVNACRLRSQSDSITSAPIYERNPYTDVDKLVCRLMNIDVVENSGIYHQKAKGVNFTIQLNGKSIIISNLDDRRNLFFNAGFFKYINYVSLEENVLNESAILVPPGETTSISCDSLTQDHIIKILTETNRKVLFLPNFNDN